MIQIQYTMLVQLMLLKNCRLIGDLTVTVPKSCYRTDDVSCFNTVCDFSLFFTTLQQVMCLWEFSVTLCDTRVVNGI